MRSKVRLVITTLCNKECEDCCMKQVDIDKVPNIIWNDLSSCKEILITGGEPMLCTQGALLEWISLLRFYAPEAKIYIYTADVSNVTKSLFLLRVTNGITLTLHTEDKDCLKHFMAFHNAMITNGTHIGKSMRLNVFKGILGEKLVCEPWAVKQDLEWIENCPVPEDEVLCKLPGVK